MRAHWAVLAAFVPMRRELKEARISTGRGSSRLASFSDHHIDPKKTISQLQAETEWWHLRRYRLLRAFHPNVNAIMTQIRYLLDDYVSIAHCREAEDLLADSFAEAKEHADEIAGIVRSDRLVGDMFADLLHHARRLRASFGDLRPRHRHA